MPRTTDDSLPEFLAISLLAVMQTTPGGVGALAAEVGVDVTTLQRAVCGMKLVSSTRKILIDFLVARGLINPDPSTWNEMIAVERADVSRAEGLVRDVGIEGACSILGLVVDDLACIVAGLPVAGAIARHVHARLELLGACAKRSAFSRDGLVPGHAAESDAAIAKLKVMAAELTSAGRR